MKTLTITPAEAAYKASWLIIDRTPFADIPEDDKENWRMTAQAAVSAHLAQVGAALPSVEEILVAGQTGDDETWTNAILTLFAERFAKLEAELSTMTTHSRNHYTWLCERTNQLQAMTAERDEAIKAIGNQAREALTLPPPPVIPMSELAKALPDDFSQSDDWRDASGPLERIEWLKTMLRARDREIASMLDRPIVAREDAEALAKALDHMLIVCRSMPRNSALGEWSWPRLEEMFEKALTAFREKYPKA